MYRDGILTARPAEPAISEPAGLHRLGLSSSRDGILLVPQKPRTRLHPLIVFLHGSGADSHNVLPILQHPAIENHCALLLPDSREYTWDILIAGFGPDVEFLDRALTHTFARCLVDPGKIALAGFSDGASYALTLGITNGELFTHVMAFSPGFTSPPQLQNSPAIFLSHGTRDEVLPVARCSRRILPTLKEWGYHVHYREFADGHMVPPEIALEAMRWFLKDGHIENDSI